LSSYAKDVEKLAEILVVLGKADVGVREENVGFVTKCDRCVEAAFLDTAELHENDKADDHDL
jgi:hypothetical protein